MVTLSDALSIVVTERIISRFPSILTSDGSDDHDWTFAADWSVERQAAAIAACDVLVCAGLDPDHARAASRLKLVHVTGAGYEKIPFDALHPDVAVANTFGHGRAIAEHILMVALMLSRRALVVNREMREGVWHTVNTDPDLALQSTLEGKVLGLVGLGSIGLEVASLANAFGMRVRAVKRTVEPDTPDFVSRIDPIEALPELLAASDVVVVATPLNHSTHGMIDEAALRRMKPTGILINVARGPIVDEQALFDALSDRAIGGAGIDVWWGDRHNASSPPSRLPFGELDNVVLTPHHSGHTVQTFEHRARDIAYNIAQLSASRPLINLVREGAQTPKT